MSHLQSKLPESISLGSVDLVLGVTKDQRKDEDVVGYYVADSANSLIWWLEEVDAELVTGLDRAVASPSHLGELHPGMTSM